jgi:CSLREA domain-containing protein
MVTSRLNLRIFQVVPNVVILLTLLIGSIAFPATVYAASITVTTANDELNNDGDCSLREAIQAANTNFAVDMCAAGSGADTIYIPAGIYTLTIAGTGENANATGDLDITGPLTIIGLPADAGDTIIEAGATPGSGIDRVFQVGSLSTTSISNVTIANGKCTSCGGGGIDNHSGNTLTVTNSIFSANTADNGGGGILTGNLSTLIVTNSTFSDNGVSTVSGGGIYSQGTSTVTNTTFLNNHGNGGGIYNDDQPLTVVNSTFLVNTTSLYGGGIYNYSGTSNITNTTFSGNTASAGAGIYNFSGFLSVTNSTFSGNGTAAGNGGGIHNMGTLYLRNTILANSSGGVDCLNIGGTIAANINNLIETNGPSGNMCGVPAVTGDPSLGSLSGSPRSFPLKSGSTAIDAGSDAVCASAPVNNTSQNGVTRPAGTHCDIGAFELNLPTTPTFEDVPASHLYWQDIEILYANGLTAGCSVTPFNFCPDQIMDRAQSAVFNLRGNFGASYIPPAGPWNTFADDWSAGTWAEKWAEGMYGAGLTAGCATNPLRYCPWDQTPKVQAAVFGLRLKYGSSYVPPAAAGTVFFDMTNTAYFGTKWAEQAYAEGLLPDCGFDIGSGLPIFCPNDFVSRGLAAYIIVRAKDLSMP